MTTEEFVASLTVDKVRSVYSGKVGECCCGCAGLHTYSSAHVAEAAKARGYPVNENEVSDTVVLRILRKLQREYAHVPPSSRFLRPTFVSVDVGRRHYIAYFTDAATRTFVGQLPAEALGGNAEVDAWRAWGKENLSDWNGVEDIDAELGRGEST